MEIPVGHTRKVGLFDGTPGNRLSVSSNNAIVVPNDGFAETKDGSNRILTFTGKIPGTTLVFVGDGKANWFNLQVVVRGSGQQEGKYVRVSKKTLKPEGQALDTLCWFSCFRMLYTWKGLDPDTVASKLKAGGIDVDQARLRGLLPEDFVKAAQALGLSAAACAQGLSVAVVQPFLYRSPLWVAGNWSGSGLHVRVITGASEDRIEYIDPWYGGTAGYDLERKDLPNNFFHGDGKSVLGADKLKGKYQMIFWDSV